MFISVDKFYSEQIRLGRRIVSEGLTRSDNFAHNFEPTPATAASWDVSDDKRTITFHIRKDAAWSNGEPLTAHDFVFSWRRSMMPDLAGDYMNTATTPAWTKA